MMKELDLSMVKQVQERHAEYKKEQEMELKQKKLRALSQKSIQNGSMRQEVYGKKYVGKQGKEKKESVIPLFCSLAMLTVSLTSGIVAADKLEQVSYYNKVLEQKMEQELTENQMAAYQKDQERNMIMNTIEKLGQIKEAHQMLDNSNYDIIGNNISDMTTEYLPFDEDSLIQLSEKDQDAIDVATDQVIEEYKSRGM